jgi:hypothetical protein
MSFTVKEGEASLRFRAPGFVRTFTGAAFPFFADFLGVVFFTVRFVAIFFLQFSFE